MTRAQRLEFLEFYYFPRWQIFAEVQRVSCVFQFALRPVMSDLDLSSVLSSLDLAHHHQSLEREGFLTVESLGMLTEADLVQMGWNLRDRRTLCHFLSQSPPSLPLIEVINPDLLQHTPAPAENYGSIRPLPGFIFSEEQAFLSSVNGEHVRQLMPTKQIRFYEIAGLLLSAGLLGFFIFQAVQSYRNFQTWNHKSLLFQEFADYFMLEFVGALLQTWNGLQGCYAFAYSSAEGLRIFGYPSGLALFWQFVQTVALISWTVTKSKIVHNIPISTWIAIVAGWMPFLTRYWANKLRFLLLTWNIPPHLCHRSDDAMPACCHPHQLSFASKGCCSSVYRCVRCNNEWDR